VDGIRDDWSTSLPMSKLSACGHDSSSSATACVKDNFCKAAIKPGTGTNFCNVAEFEHAMAVSVI